VLAAIMDNSKILQLLENQRDSLFKKLNETSISGLYKAQYADIIAGRLFVFDNGERQMLRELKELSKDTSLDKSFKNKLNEYLGLDNKSLIKYFQGEYNRVFNKIASTGKQSDIQALF
jgi:hypothetical protein